MIKKYLKIFVGVGFLSIASFMLYSRMHFTLVVQDFICSFDPLFSQDAKHAMQADIDTFKGQEQVLAATAQELEQSCEAIKTVRLRCVTPNSVSVTIGAQQPILRINDTLIWTDQQQLIDAACYDQKSIVQCPAISLAKELIADRESAEQLLINLADRLPHDLLHAYHVTIINPYLMSIKEKPTDWFSIHCSSSTIPAAARLVQCKAIKNELEVTHTGTKRYQQWVADVRFRDQIIVRADRGM